MTTAAAAQPNSDAAAAAAAAAAPAAAAAAPAAAPDAAAAAAAAAAAPPDAAAAAKKTADDAAAAAAADAAKNQPPAKYELAKPAGSEYFLDDAALTQFETKARAKGWTNEQAQAALDEGAGEAMTLSSAWKAETEADPVWGGEKLGETQRLANLALDKVAPKGDPIGDRFRALMLKGAAFNELSVVATLAKLGKLMAEDTPIVGSGGRKPAGDSKDPANLYDHPTSRALDKESSKA
jgi:hypothetical protein